MGAGLRGQRASGVGRGVRGSDGSVGSERGGHGELLNPQQQGGPVHRIQISSF